MYSTKFINISAPVIKKSSDVVSGNSLFLKECVFSEIKSSEALFSNIKSFEVYNSNYLNSKGPLFYSNLDMSNTRFGKINNFNYFN